MKILPTWQLLIFYGIFLFVMGVLGFLSNPEKAKTALLSGSFFGGLSVTWGLIYRKGQQWGLVAALITLVLVTVAFVWRAIVSWISYFEGNTDKLIGAVLITAMLTAGLLILPKIVAGLKKGSR